MIDRGTNRLALTFFVLITFVGTVSQAQEPAKGEGGSEAAAYAKFYGDGMRHYAEGRNEEAIANFYHAYALRPSALLLKLIVRTHDFMGHCSAAQLQLEHFGDKHPNKKPPRLQICRDPGRLQIACARGVEEVVIDDSIRTRCGKTLALPPGEHRVRSVTGGPAEIVVVKAGETVELRVDEVDARRSKTFAKVPLLEDNERYLVIQAPDGLYQLWVRTPLRDDPDMKGSTGPAGFIIERGSDGLYHITEKPADNDPSRSGAKGN